MLFGNFHIEIPDQANASTRSTVEILCAALEAALYEQDHLVTSLLQALLIQEAVSVTHLAVNEHDFNMDQEQFCHECESIFVSEKLPAFVRLATREISHAGYDMKQIGITLDDMRIAACLVYLEEFSDDYEMFIEEQMVAGYVPSRDIL